MHSHIDSYDPEKRASVERHMALVDKQAREGLNPGTRKGKIDGQKTMNDGQLLDYINKNNPETFNFSEINLPSKDLKSRAMRLLAKVTGVKFEMVGNHVKIELPKK